MEGVFEYIFYNLITNGKPDFIEVLLHNHLIALANSCVVELLLNHNQRQLNSVELKYIR